MSNHIQIQLEEALFGCAIKVSSPDCPNAKSYRVFDHEQSPITAISEIGTFTTAFPKQEQGNTVYVALFDQKGQELVIEKVSL